MKPVAAALSLCFLFSLTPLSACIWDSDTLRAEAKGVPTIIETISGRFDRFPPRYYEMRRDRVLKIIEQDANNLALYDDLAVSYDRLGDSSTAIFWMEKKGEVLKQHPDKEHQYRYLANLGTFYIHRWLKAGADFSDRNDVFKACELIEKAIELNPDAHFGREKYQLQVLHWLRDLPAPSSDSSAEEKAIAHIPFDESEEYRGTTTDPNSKPSEAVVGYSGLITLGAAWESYDIFLALSQALSMDSRNHIAHLASLRINELSKQGKKSIASPLGEVYTRSYSVLRDPDIERADKYYTELRNEAKTWREERMNYINSQLDAGKHPDTHADFWGSYRERTSPPKPPVTMRVTGPFAYAFWIKIIFYSLLSLLALIAVRQFFKARAA